ncbi:MAG: electron transfer flavoprotein subunit alpha/FixB family protein [Bacteroidetes bacterium]|nr:electron transfer flavoprotein subunit alpha/FixB family protein [Bacteroidota bacterium]
MANKVLVFLEQRNGQIKKASFEAAKVGAELAAKLGIEAEAVVIGNEVESPEKVGGFGIKKVTHLKNALLENYSDAYKELLTSYTNEINADYLLFGNTAMGKDLAPKLSAKLDAGAAMDILAYEVEGENLKATRPVYAGKALINVNITSAIKILSLRPNVFNAGEATTDTAEVTVKEVEVTELKTKVTELKKAGDKLDVSEAEFIVAGGRGLKEADKFSLVEDLAKELGAAIGASRAVVDAGWRPHSEQVGQTGKTVSPTLYIALGISGAIQHLAGMRSSKYIVAINKDADAPIFQIADYGITGDVFEVVPALIEEIKKVKNG